MLHWFVEKVLRPKWVASEGMDSAEMGLRILGVNLWYYKWPDPMVSKSRRWRYAAKREFGETVKSQIESQLTP